MMVWILAALLVLAVVALLWVGAGLIYAAGVSKKADEEASARVAEHAQIVTSLNDALADRERRLRNVKAKARGYGLALNEIRHASTDPDSRAAAASALAGSPDPEDDEEVELVGGPHDGLRVRSSEPMIDMTDVVLGRCPHGVDLDRGFCSKGCRV